MCFLCIIAIALFILFVYLFVFSEYIHFHHQIPIWRTVQKVRRRHQSLPCEREVAKIGSSKPIFDGGIVVICGTSPLGAFYFDHNPPWNCLISAIPVPPLHKGGVGLCLCPTKAINWNLLIFMEIIDIFTDICVVNIWNGESYEKKRNAGIYNITGMFLHVRMFEKRYCFG